MAIMRKELLAPTQSIVEYKTEPISNLVFLVRLPGPNNNWRPLRDVDQMITQTSMEDIVDWYQLKPAPFPRTLFVNETRKNRDAFEQIKKLIDDGHSARAFIRNVPGATAGQQEYVLAFGAIVITTKKVALPLNANPPERPVHIQASPTGKVDVHLALERHTVLPSGHLSKVLTASLVLDSNNNKLETPAPFPMDAWPKWIHSVRMRAKFDRCVGLIDIAKYPANAEFFRDHKQEMDPVPFPQTIEVHPNVSNLAKLERIRERIRSRCFGSAFFHLWNGHPYLVLVFTDDAKQTMKAIDEAPTAAPTPTPMATTPMDVVNEVANERKTTSKELSSADENAANKEVRRNMWLSISRGNVFNVSRIRKLIPPSLLREWHQYELKAIRAMAPEFVGAHFHKLIE